MRVCDMRCGKRVVACLMLALSLSVASQAEAQRDVSPLPADHGCRRYELIALPIFGVYPGRTCGSFEASLLLTGVWVRSSSRRAPSGGLGHELLLRYRARWPLLVELAVGPGLSLWGHGTTRYVSARGSVALDLRGFRLGVGLARVRFDQPPDPESHERVWAAVVDARLGASDGLAIRAQVRQAPDGARYSRVGGRFLSDVSLQIPLYPMHTTFKHFASLGFRYDRANFAEFWLGTKHQLTRGDSGALLLRLGILLLLDLQGDDDAWIGRGVSAGLEWRVQIRRPTPAPEVDLVPYPLDVPTPIP